MKQIKILNKDISYRLIAILAVTILLGWFTFFQSPKLGLDLKGGVSVLIEAQDTKYAKADINSMRRLMEILDRRINRLGVTEPVIQLIGTRNVLVEIPGVQKTEEAIEMLGKTALLEFKLKNADGSLGETLLTGQYLKKAQVGYDEVGRPDVEFELTAEGAQIFAKITRENIGKQLAITLDGIEQTAPVINSEIPSGRARISRQDGSIEESKKLALLLDAGALPLDVKIIETRTVSATLGDESIHASFKSGILAAIMICLFMVMWYFLPGIIACIALLIFGIISFGALNMLDATLTLPGIAGFIFSLGMAVDANIIIFEMIREELRGGVPVSAAIKAGFKRAFSSIWDSNITTLISTAVLFLFGTGPIRGYAITLSLGVLLSMFTAIFVTRVLLELVINVFNIRSPKFFRVDATKVAKKRRINIIKCMHFTFIISILLALVSIGSISFKGFNKGVDFTGGNLLQLQFTQPIDEAAFTNEVEYFNKNVNEIKPNIQFSETLMDGKFVKNTAIIRTVDISKEIKSKLYEHLKSKFGEYQIQKEDIVGATVGKDLRWNAIKSVIIAALLMMVYLSFRFEARFAIGAVIAVLHDVLISVGLISLMGYEINSSFIVAVLTILGYSINDTIIVYDRIRANRSKAGNIDAETSAEIMNTSMSQVLSRTINTSLTVLLSVVALLVFGGESLQTLLITFLAGIVTGTCSSIFVASPIVYLFDKYGTNKKNNVNKKLAVK